MFTTEIVFAVCGVCGPKCLQPITGVYGLRSRKFSTQHMFGQQLRVFGSRMCSVRKFSVHHTFGPRLLRSADVFGPHSQSASPSTAASKLKMFLACKDSNLGL